MLRTAFILLTGFAVLWHATAGCCAHHAHAAEASERPATVAAASCCGHRHAGPAEASHRGESCDERRSESAARLADAHDRGARLGDPDETSAPGFCGERCSFPQPEGSGDALVKRTLAACDLALPVATILFEVEALPAEDLSACESPPPSHAGAALRRHLALGVLLI